MQAQSSDYDHLKWLTELGIKTSPNLTFLDVGCGSGYLCHDAMENGAKQAVGLDIIEPKGFTNQSKWQFINCDLNANNCFKCIDEQKFDLIVAFDILEHLDSPYLFLKNIRDRMSHGSTLVLTTPNLLSWERFVRPQNWSGVRDVQHKSLFTRYSLNFLLSKAGFKSIIMKAPIRSLGGLSRLTPQIGGQIVCVATRQA